MNGRVCVLRLIAVRLGHVHAVRDGSAASALRKATKAVRAIGMGREARVLLMSVFLSVV